MQGYTHFQQNELVIARQKLENGVALMVDALWPSIAVFGLYVLAQIHWVRGELSLAVAHLQRAMGMIYTQESISFWSVAQLQALQALLNLNLGDIEAACSWQKRYAAPPASQVEAFVYARLCLADGRLHTAKTDLTRLLVEVEQCPRLFTPVDVLLPLAVVYWRQANVRAAVVALKNAVHVSQAQHYRRPFLDWAVELEALFQLVISLPEMEGNGRSFLQTIIPGSWQPAADRTILQRLAQLTGREQQLLEQVGAGTTNRQIADTFALAESTVKTHLRHVYQKLGVKNRQEAASLLAKAHLRVRHK
jgi:LuxR family maltose regulon positive regulatory protein